MFNYLTVTLGSQAQQDLAGQRLTKKWLRDYLRSHPLTRFADQTHGSGYLVVDASIAVRDGLTFEVHNDRSESVAVVEFQAVNGGFQAVVR